MELAQKRLIEQVGISYLDTRLRGARENAKDLFEKILSHASMRHVHLNDHDRTAKIYTYCLAWALHSAGIEVPAECFPNDTRLMNIMRELSS